MGMGCVTVGRQIFGILVLFLVAIKGASADVIRLYEFPISELSGD